MSTRPRPPRSDSPDSELYRATARLSINDIAQIGATRGYYAGNSAEDMDARLAHHLAMEEARNVESVERDRALAMRLQTGEEEDVWQPPRPRATAIAAMAHMNTPAGLYRQAYSIEGRPAPTTRPIATTTTFRRTQAVTNSRPGWDTGEGNSWGIFGTIFNWLLSTSPVVAPSVNPELVLLPQRSATISNRTNNRLTGHDCVTCMDPIRGIEICAPCGHHYDKACILGLFEAATKDESLFPPRCCRQPIPLRLVETHMDSITLKTFRSKEHEFGTRKRVYCAKPACSRFLGAQYEGSSLIAYIAAPRFTCTAPGCGTITCSSCKNPCQPSVKHRCATNDADSGVLALGRESGWARCPGCETMIELNLGCYHMTCRCRTEFCYLCQARWKTCGCPQWDERRLIAAAEVRADAQLRQGAAVHIQVRPRVARDVPAVPRNVVTDPLRTAAVPVPIPVRRETTAIRTVVRRLQVPQTTAAGPSASTSRTRSDGTARTTTTANDIHDWRNSVASATNTTRPATRPTLRTSIIPDDMTQEQRRIALVRQWADRLREDHDCQHQDWQYRKGAGQCEVCHSHLPLYLFRCGGCEMMACRRCRWNRL